MIIHVVKAGESIYSIAKKYGVPFQRILADNELSYPDDLVIGQTIIVLTDEEPKRLGSIVVNGYVYPSVDLENLEEALPFLTFVSIFSYGFTPEGELIDVNDKDIIYKTKEYGDGAIMMLTTINKDGTFNAQKASDMLNNEDVQDTLIENIKNTLKDKGYSGLDVDFEYLPAEDKDAYSQFIDRLTDILNPLGYFVSVALAPKTTGEETGPLFAAHDYYAMGQNANAVLLMTYEWGYTYGPPMAVAPINKVRDVVKYAVSEVPTDKIFIGIPNYGYDWNIPYVKGTAAKAISNEGAIDLARSVGAIIQYDELAQAPFFRYYDKDGQQHEVWFEDARSILAKLKLVAEYKLQGISVWTVMKYFRQLWVVLYNTFDIDRIN